MVRNEGRPEQVNIHVNLSDSKVYELFPLQSIRSIQRASLTSFFTVLHEIATLKIARPTDVY